MRARVEANATRHQAADLCRALEGMRKEMRGRRERAGPKMGGGMRKARLLSKEMLVP
jgi:hypothetical protein